MSFARPRGFGSRTSLALVFTLAVIAMLAALLPNALLGTASAAAKKKQKPAPVKVMSRNLYLGADLGPAVAATSITDFTTKNGQVLRDVDANNFPVRAKGLASEILTKSPDVVGLQEAAMWRTGDPNLDAALGGPKTATTVRYDYLKSLMGQLNKGKKHYTMAISNDQFDFEAPADLDNNPATGPFGGEINGRLTMRDALLIKIGTGIKVKNVKGSHFNTLYQPVISGVPVTVQRGWVRADVKIGKAPWLRFVDTHLESFGDPTIREAQAKELVAKYGPATGRLPVILIGDLNSDHKTTPGPDALAYDALIKAGLRERATTKPHTCCIASGILTDNFGSLGDFTESIDHVMTNAPKQIKLKSASVTGRVPQNGFWDSDHAGMFSSLLVRK